MEQNWLTLVICLFLTPWSTLMPLWFARAAITRYHGLGDLKQRNYCLVVLEAKSLKWVPAAFVPTEGVPKALISQ